MKPGRLCPERLEKFFAVECGESAFNSKESAGQGSENHRPSREASAWQGRQRKSWKIEPLQRWDVSLCCGAIRGGRSTGCSGKEAAFMEIIIWNYPASLKWASLWASGFSPFLSTLWQATTATKTATVLRPIRRAQNRNRRRPEIILVGSAVVITRITLRTPLQPRGQTFRRLRHRPIRRRRARASSLRLHLPQRHKRQPEDLLGAAAKENWLPLFFRRQIHKQFKSSTGLTSRVLVPGKCTAA